MQLSDVIFMSVVVEMCPGANPKKEHFKEFKENLDQFQTVVKHLDCSHEDFVKKLNSSLVEDMNHQQQVAFDLMLKLIPEVRIFCQLTREVIWQNTQQANNEMGKIRKHKRIIKKRGDGIVKRGQLVTYTVTAVVDKQTITKNCTRVMCVECHKNFTSMDHFIEHGACKSVTSNLHGYVSGRTCKECHQLVDLSQPGNFESHMSKCTGQGTPSSRKSRKYRANQGYDSYCHKCGPDIRYATHAALLAHTIACTTPEPKLPPGERKKDKTCEECGFKAQSDYHIRQHKKVHLTDEEREEKIRSGKTNAKECKVCNKYIEKSQMRNHSKSHKRINEKEMMTCPFCFKDMNPFNLRMHVHVKRGDCSLEMNGNKCPKCKVWLEDQFALTSHKKECSMIITRKNPPSAAAGSSEEAQKNAPSAAAGSSAQATAPKSAQQPGQVVVKGKVKETVRDWKCRFCKYGFGSESACNVHMTGVHRGAMEPDACPWCGKVLHGKKARMDHKDNCTGTKRCRWCFAVFDKDIDGHMVMCKHKTTCIVCNKSFPNDQYLTSHVLAFNHTSLVACKGCELFCMKGRKIKEHEACCEAVLKMKDARGSVDHRIIDNIKKTERTNDEDLPLLGGTSSRTSHKKREQDGRQASTMRQAKLTQMVHMVPLDPLTRSAVDDKRAKQRAAVGANNNYNWEVATQIILKCQNVQSLKDFLAKISKAVPPLQINYTRKQVDSDEIDNNTRGYMRQELRDKYVPIKTDTDGNCMLRSISRFLFGTEHRYQEVRVRMAIEAFEHAEWYVSRSHLAKGYKGPAGDDNEVLKFYLLEADQRNTNDRKVLRKIFDEQLLRWSKDTVRLGMWQLHVASGMCGGCIEVVHPVLPENNTVSHIYNRKILPRQLRLQPTMRIMWTTTKKLQPGTPLLVGHINHFVPVVKIKQ